MSKLRESIESGKFTITGEIGPPKGTDIEPCLHEAVEFLKDRVVAVNVTDIQSSVMRFGSMAACHLLIDRGVEPVLQMVCRDRNRLALQSDLLSACGLGIENVLCLTGDHQRLGDHPQAKGVFDLDSVQLLNAAKTLMAGKDLSGNTLQGNPKLFLGAVVTPGADPLEPQVIKMEKKVEAGAQFFQTQAVYDPRVFETFMKSCEYLKVPVLAGIVMLKTAGMAKYMNQNVAGVNVPQELIDRMAAASKEDRPKVSIEIAAKLMKEMKPMCQGIHIMPLGWDKYVPQLLDAAGV